MAQFRYSPTAKRWIRGLNAIPGGLLIAAVTVINEESAHSGALSILTENRRRAAQRRPRPFLVTSDRACCSGLLARGSRG
jgi:hypothetical protein